MGISARTYPIELTDQQHRFLKEVMHTNSSPLHHSVVAGVLLGCDQSQGQPEETDAQLAERFAISRRRVIRIKERFVKGGLDAALAGRYQQERPERRRLDGAGEAQLIAVACGPAPEGHQRWTIRLLADRLVTLQVVDRISPETVRQILKKKCVETLAQDLLVFSEGSERRLCLPDGRCPRRVLPTVPSQCAAGLHG